MKSKDELSLAMARVICPAVSTEKCVNGTCPKLWDCPVKISIFEKLVDAGFTDGIEERKQIALLNENISNLQDQYWESCDEVDWFNDQVSDLNDALRRKNKDIINRVKEKLHGIGPMGAQQHIERQLDELLEELEREQEEQEDGDRTL